MAAEERREIAIGSLLLLLLLLELLMLCLHIGCVHRRRRVLLVRRRRVRVVLHCSGGGGSSSSSSGRSRSSCSRVVRLIVALHGVEVVDCAGRVRGRRVGRQEASVVDVWQTRAAACCRRGR